MDITFDPAKNARNIRERGLSFERAAAFEFKTAIFWIDNRRDYGEIRRVALGYLDGRLHVLCFLATATRIPVISLRRATQERSGEMRKRKPLIDEDGEVRELLMEDIKRFRPASEVLTPSLAKKLGIRLRNPEKGKTNKPAGVKI